jgi:hypothetical protein
VTSENQDDQTAEAAAGSGSASFAGYLYQVRVTVYVALVLLLGKKEAHQITVEPKSEEDIEAEVENEAPVEAVSTSLGTYTLVVQVKHRTTGPWGIVAIKSLLTKERERRTTPKERLTDQAVRYLLITDAAVTGDATSLRVKAVGQWPKVPSMKKNLLSALESDADGRVAVYSQLEERVLDLLIKELLVESFRVPISRWGDCYAAMCEEATGRMVGRAANIWGRDALEAVVQRFDGFLASSPELASYVRPTNWDEICRQLKGQHAVILKGKSGTGKTMTAEALWDHISSTEVGFVRIRVEASRGSRDVTEYRGADPVVFDIEDPWGRFKFEEQRATWNEELPHLLRTASGTRKFVITSRSDVLVDASAPESLKRWFVPLEAESYSRIDRHQFFDKKVRQLSLRLRHQATKHREDVLKALETLYELQKFFDFLSAESSGETRPHRPAVRIAIESASVEAIEKTIQSQIRSRQALHWSYVLWGVFQARSTILWETLDALHSELSVLSDQYDRGIHALVSFMVAGRNIRQNDDHLSYYHPRVESALKTLVAEEPVASGKGLAHLVTAFVSLDIAEDDGDLGRRSAARILKATKAVPGLKLRVPTPVQQRLDDWLTEQLAANGEHYDALLSLAAASGSESCPPATLARYLTDHAVIPYFPPHPPPKKKTERFMPTSEWVARVSVHPTTKTIVRRFVEEVLPGSNSMHYEGLATVLEQVAGDLSASYVAAAQKIIYTGGIRSDDAILEGATRNLDALAPVAIEAMAYSQKLNITEPAERLAIHNGEYSDGDLEHMGESLGEQDYVPDMIATTYVRERRARQGWRVLTTDPAKDMLLQWWLEILKKAETPHTAEVDEWLAVAAIAIGSPLEEKFWEVADAAWHPCLDGCLEQQLVSQKLGREVRLNILDCAANHAVGTLEAAVRQLIAAGEIRRLVELHSDLWHLSSRRSTYKDQREIELTWLQALPTDLRPLFETLARAPADAALPPSEPALRAVNGIAPGSEDATFARLRVQSASNAIDAREIANFLASAEDIGNAEGAMRLAVHHCIAEVLSAGLKHRFAAVVAVAATGIAEGLAVLPPEVLGLADHSSHFVKEALLATLVSRAPDDYIPTLLSLCHDRWSNSSYGYGDTVCYPIARGASEHVAKCTNLDEATQETLLELATSTYDDDLRDTLFRAIARLGSHWSQTMLLDIALAERRSTGERAYAAAALLHAVDALDGAVVRKAAAHSTAPLPSFIATCIVAIAGSRGSPPELDQIASTLSSSTHRRVLLLVLAACVKERNDSALDLIYGYLPARHPAFALLDDSSESLLPRHALDDLGDFDTVSVVIQFFEKRFEPKQTPKRIPMFGKSHSAQI